MGGESADPADTLMGLDDLGLGVPFDDRPHRPKRPRSKSYEDILSDLPDEGLELPPPLEGCDNELSSGFIFPPTSTIKTPTQSITRPAFPLFDEQLRYKTQSGQIIESKERPNFLKPMSLSEKQQLRSAGRGAAIIRVSTDAFLL